MSFLKRFRSRSKIKQVRSESDLTLQEKVRKQEAETTPRSVTRDRTGENIQVQTTLLEERLNKPETRSSPPIHIEIIRQLASNYLKLGTSEFSYYRKAENLYKQMNVLYPFHMEKIDWITWIEASAKSKLIREARRLLEEARMLFPGDEDLDQIETTVLHIAQSTT